MNNGGCFGSIVTKRSGLWGGGGVVLSGACAERSSCAERYEQAAHQRAGVMLTLHACNYTDHYIDSYSVNGAGGGDVFVSSPTTGGGGGACCVRWIAGPSLPVTMHTRWESGECLYIENIDGKDFKEAKSFYSEKDVRLEGPVPADPWYFETHFYPDGHIEVAITDDYSPPRLRLPEESDVRPGVKPWHKCTSKQLRQEAIV